VGLFSGAGGGGRQLKLTLLGDSKQLERTLGRTETRLQKFGKKTQAITSGSALAGKGGFGTSGAVLAGGGFGIAAGLATKKAVDLANAASDMNEQLTKSRAVFGTASQGLETWSKSTAGSIGVARVEALQATGTFGNLFNTVGIGGKQATSMSQALVTLAADLASFNNANPSDTLDAIRSGLIGEAEPLRRYGVLLSEARVQQRAMADTGKASAAALTQQEKALARYEIILNDTEKAQGDFARTSGGLANQQRILKAELADTKAELGARLLPAYLKVTEAAVGLVKSFNGIEASAEQLNSVDFRQKLSDVFGIDQLRDIIGKLGPELAAIQAQFVKDISGIPTFVPPTVSGPGKGPIPFGQPGFKPSKPGTPVTLVSTRLQGQELDARLSGSSTKIKAVLQKEAAFLKNALTDVRLKPADENKLKQALLSVTGEITSINDAAADAANQAASDARQAAEATRQKAADARRKAKAARDKHQQAMKDALAATTKFLDSLRQGALDKLSRKETAVDVSRQMTDAKKALAVARMIGTPGGIKEAERGVQDAQFSRERMRVENAKFGGSNGNATITIGNITLTGIQNVDQFIAALQKRSKTNTTQTRGRTPGYRPF